MAFASLQEAWGVPTLGGAESAAPAAAFERDSTYAAAQEPELPSPPPATPAARDARRRGRVAAPAAAADEEDVAAAMRVLEAAYGRGGTDAVLELLPRGVARRLSRRRRRRRRGSSSSRHGGPWAWLARVAADPDTALLVLVAAFLALLAWDSCGGSRSELVGGPSLASLHMSPFPLGTS